MLKAGSVVDYNKLYQYIKNIQGSQPYFSTYSGIKIWGSGFMLLKVNYLRLLLKMRINSGIGRGFGEVGCILTKYESR